MNPELIAESEQESHTISESYVKLYFMEKLMVKLKKVKIRHS